MLLRRELIGREHPSVRVCVRDSRMRCRPSRCAQSGTAPPTHRHLEKDDDESFKKLTEKAKKDGEKEITMIIESWGQIPPKEIFADSIEMLNKEIKDLIKEVK